MLRNRQLPIFLCVLLLMSMLCFSIRSYATDCLIEDPIEARASAWQGNIGDIPVTMQFSQNSDYLIFGHYHYRNSFNDLTLKPNEAMTGWNEYNSKNEITGSIEDYQCEGNLLTGVWKSVDGKKILSLKANRVKITAEKPFENIKFTITNKKYGHHEYQLLSVPISKSTGLRLAEKSDSIQKINASLLKDYLSQIEDDVDCIRYGNNEGKEFESKNTLSISEWNAAFVSIRSNSSEYCGGAHSNFGSYVKVYNLISGTLENTATWLKEDYQDKFQQISKDNPLGKQLSKHYIKQRVAKEGISKDEAEDCLEAISFYSSGAWINIDSMFFNTGAAYVASPCIVEIMLPHKVVTPFLSTRGRLAVKLSGRQL